MKIIRKDDPPKEDRSNAPIFFGGKVTGQSIVGPEMNEYFNFTMVSFAAGARNKFHAHTTDQVLYVTEGDGIVATEGEEVRVTRGDTAWIPAGEKHWHGATPESDFSHISLQAAGSTTTVFD